MRLSLLVLMVAVALGACGQPVENIYPAATQVRLFVNTGYEKGSGMPIYSSPGKLLNGEQREYFEQALSITKTPEEMAACFIPHHYFRYYDKTGKQIGEISVRFCCGGVEVEGASNIRLKAGETVGGNLSRIASLVEDLGEPTDILCDE